MKRNYIYYVLLFLFCTPSYLSAQLAEVATPFTLEEDFNYSANTNLGQKEESVAKGWQNFIKGTVTNKTPIRVVSPGLTFGAFEDENSNCIKIIPPIEENTVNSNLRWNLFDEQHQLRNGSIYFSMLIHVKEAFETHESPFFSCFRLEDKVNYALGSGSNGNMYIVKNNDNTYRIGITRFNVNKNNAIVFAPENLNFNTTYHIIFKLQYGNVTKEIEGISTTVREETARLYIDPQLHEEPTLANAEQIGDVTKEGKGSAVNHMAFMAQNGEFPHMMIDRIRIADSWNGLHFPTDGIATPSNETSFSVFTTANEMIVRNLKTGDSVQLFDIHGRAIVSKIAQNAEMHLSLTQKGLYLIKVNDKTIKVIF